MTSFPLQWIGLCLCAVPSRLGRASPLEYYVRKWAGCRPESQHVVPYERVLTVNFNSMSSSNVVSGILIQTNAMWDQAHLCLMQCFVVLLCTKRWVMLHRYHRHMCCDRWAVTSGEMMDVDWDTQCVSVKPWECLSVFVYCSNYMHFSQMLLIIQTVYVYGNVYGIEYAKKNINISLNDYTFPLLFFLLTDG